MGSRRVRGQGRRKAACSIPTPARLPSCLVQGVENDSDSVGRAAHAQRATVSPYVGHWSGPGPNSSRGSSYTTAGASVHYWSQLSGWRHLTARLDFFSLYIGREHVISLSYQCQCKFKRMGVGLDAGNQWCALQTKRVVPGSYSGALLSPSIKLIFLSST